MADWRPPGWEAHFAAVDELLEGVVAAAPALRLRPAAAAAEQPSLAGPVAAALAAEAPLAAAAAAPALEGSAA